MGHYHPKIINIMKSSKYYISIRFTMGHYHPKMTHIMKSSKYYIIRFTMPPQVGKTVECLSYLSLTFQIEPFKSNIYMMF